MTADQITNWRNVLCGMLGPYALIMPEEQIIAIRDKLQKDALGYGAHLATSDVFSRKAKLDRLYQYIMSIDKLREGQNKICSMLVEGYEQIYASEIPAAAAADIIRLAVQQSGLPLQVQVSFKDDLSVMMFTVDKIMYRVSQKDVGNDSIEITCDLVDYEGEL